jgi:hypothetical protein
MRGDRLEDEAPRGVVLWCCPEREGEGAAGAKHAARFGKRALGPLDVMDAEIRHDGIEARIGKRELLGIAGLEGDGRMAPARLHDHLGGKIHAGHARAQRRRPRGGNARPARDIEQARARPDARGFQQRIDEQCRNAGEAVVGRRRGAPAGVFEVADAGHAAAI